MIKEKKAYSRSLRMSETVRNYVEKQPGNGFNQQFENMVLYCMEKEPELKKSIREKEKRYKDLCNKIAAAESLLSDIRTMEYQISNVIATANRIVGNSGSLKDDN